MKGWLKKESLAYLWGVSAGWRGSILLDSLVGIASVLLSLAFIFLSKLAIDVATGAVAGIRLWQAGTGLLVLLLLQLGCNVCEGWIGMRMQVGAGNGLRHRLFAHLLYSRWNELEHFHTGDIVNRVERDVSAVVSLLTVSVPSLLIVGVQLLVAFAFFCLLDPWLPWAVMAVLPLFLPLARFYMRRMNRYTHAIRQSDSHIQSLIQESLQHRLVVKALEQNRRHVGRLDERQREWSGQIMQRTRFSLASRLLVSLAFSGGYLIAFLWGTIQLGEGLITFGTMAAFLQLVGKIQQPVLGLARLLPAFAEAFTAADRLLELEHVSVEDAAEPLRFHEPPAVEIHDLTFRYSPGDRAVFTRFSCHFPAGSCTAVVGETGKGKTTLVRLLLALVEPEEGSSCLRVGQHVCPLSAETRCNFTYVPQGNTLFSGTVRDNLRMGNPQATDEDMRRALRTAVAEFVFTLPGGLNASLGEQGGGLSEGQAQRIAIARALLRPAGILLLDEATSALDPATERQFLTRLKQGYADRTIIFVTHHEAVAAGCERVVRL